MQAQLCVCRTKPCCAPHPGHPSAGLGSLESYKAWLTSPLLARPQNATCMKLCVKTSHSILLIAITRLTKIKCSHQSRNVESPQNVGLPHRNAEQSICHLSPNLHLSPATTAAPRRAISVTTDPRAVPCRV